MFLARKGLIVFVCLCLFVWVCAVLLCRRNVLTLILLVLSAEALVLVFGVGLGGALWTVREGAERSGRVIRASRPGPDAMFKKQPESSI